MDERSEHFGLELRRRRARAELSLEAAQAACGVPRNSLSRYERGQLPPQDRVEKLDELYEAGGELVAEWAAAAGRPVAGPRRLWTHNFPASYSGPVWVRLELPERMAERECEFQLRWGPWLMRRRFAWLPEEGSRAFWMTKGDDGESVPLSLFASHAVEASFHIGAPPDGAANLNYGWERVERLRRS